MKNFAIWNPVDLGYAAVIMAYNIATGKAEAGPGAAIPIGHVGSVTLDENGDAAMAPPTIYDVSNVEEAAELF